MEGFEKTIVPIVPETLPKLLLIAKYASFLEEKIQSKCSIIIIILLTNYVFPNVVFLESRC